MKKNVLIYLIVLVIVTFSLSFIFLNKSKNEITDQTEITKIVNDSNLEILLNLENFSTENFSEENLLEVAMMFAESNGYINETTEGMYLQYVNQPELHDIIKELTNILVEAPIQIEDFYYLYDSENEYYYSVPVNFTTYKISAINHVYKTDDTYTIECTATKTEDGEIIEQKNIKTKLKFIENASYSDYQVVSQNFS